MMDSIFMQKDNTYTKNEIFITNEEMENLEVNMSDFEFKFAFGLQVDS